MLVKKELDCNVIEAARNRIIDTFSKGRKVQLCFSGGKDSIVLADIVYNLILSGKINAKNLQVIFIDEEAMFDDVINIVKHWRQKFLEVGAEFLWFCLQVKHFNCLNSMTEEETFICWDEAKKDSWVRPMPPYAIKDDEFLIPYKDNYQSFLDRYCSAHKLISMRGVRVSESVQRLKYIARMKTESISLPIYDMLDKDMWLYLLKYNIEYPDVYENLYRIGRNKKQLRISQFFSVDTAQVLVSLGEMYPDLMERVEKREPNAYLCALYWDTEMFGRNTKKRQTLEEDSEEKDYKSLTLSLMAEQIKEGKNLKQIRYIKQILLRHSNLIIDADYKDFYKVLVAGDPKQRRLRAISTNVSSRRNI